MRVMFSVLGMLGVFMLFSGIGLIDESASIYGMMIGLGCSLIGLIMMMSYVLYDHSRGE